MKTKLIALTLYFILAVSFIGCGTDNDTIIKEQISKAEELKESGKESEAFYGICPLINLPRSLRVSRPVNFSISSPNL